MTCPRKEDVSLAVKRGEITPEIERHVTDCAECSESVRISSALLASSEHVKIERADARIIWLLAAERRQADTEQKFNRVIRLVPGLAAMIVAAAATIWVVLFGGSADALLGASGRVGPVFLIAAAFVVLVVWTAPSRGRSS
jgi:hypothetical protein